MKPIKNQMFLLLLFFLSSTAFASAAFAADKPVWIIDYKKLNLPKHTVNSRDKTDTGFNVQFTPDNKILVSFLQYSPQIEFATKDIPEKSDTLFVVLQLSRENGELIRRVEWPVMPESTPWRQTKIYPLYSGGYVGIIDRLDFTAEYREVVTHLQTFDLSFNVIHDRILDTFKRGDGAYRLIVPLSGKFIILTKNVYDKSYPPYESIIEIIDSDTFKTMERFEPPNFIIADIWENRLLATGYAEDTRKAHYIEKKIGVSQWSSLGLKGEHANAKYIHNGAIVVTGSIGPVYDRKSFWYILEDDKKGDPVFNGCVSKSSWNTPVVACEKNKTSAIRSLLDLFGKHWIEAYDLSTRRVLLKTKAYSQDSVSREELVDYAISPDGDSIVLMTNKKIELYNVNSKKKKK